MKATGTVLDEEKKATHKAPREEPAGKGQDFVMRSLNEIEDP